MTYVFRRGDPPGICVRCGAKVHVSELRREWNGLRVCGDCWDPRHPQMNIRGVPDPQKVKGGAAPEPTDVFQAVNEYVTSNGEVVISTEGAVLALVQP